MKSIRILVLTFPFLSILTMPFFSKAAEKDVLKEWIEKDMEEAAINRLDEIAVQRDKAKLEASKGKISQLYREAKEYLKIKRYDEVRQRYEKILELNPGEAKAREYLAKLDEIQALVRAREMKQQMAQKGLETRDELKRLSQEGAELYRKKKYEEAREKWEEALKYDPDDESLKEWIKRARIQEQERIREELNFEKELEERASLSAIDKAYLPKTRKKAGPEKTEEEMVTKEEEGKRKIEEMLEKIEISELHLKDVDLRNIVNEISMRTKVTILVDWTAISEATGLRMAPPAAKKKAEEGGEGTKEEEEEEETAPVETGEIKTMHLDLDIYSPMPLNSLFDYLMKLTRLKYRVEEHAVLISTPQALEKEEMVVKVYKLKYGLTRLRAVTLKPLGKEEEK